MNAPTSIKTGFAVYAKIAAVQGELAKVGIAKNRRNQQGSGYNFRGIDDVYAALSPLLAASGLVIVPRMTERVCVERQTKAGGALFNVTVKAEFDFIAAEDGSIHTASTYGEAMDSADKATNKAMSAAYKYAAFMTFAIPTEGDNDADAVTHEIAAGGQSGKGAQSAPGSNPDTLRGQLEQSVAQTKREPAHSKLKTELRGFVHELEGIGDWDVYCAFRDSADFKRLVAECKDKLPQLWDGGPDMPEEFVPLHRRIELIEATLSQQVADIARA